MTKDFEQTPLIIRNYNDTVFRMLFQKKQELLLLFNAVNGTNYTDPEEMTINTLENAVYMNMKNDISCVLDMQLNLYEHQSTVNPNMPLRDLFYVSRLYEAMIKDGQVYGTKKLELPAPKFIVFYNGGASQPERRCLYLSDLYVHKPEEVSLELMVIQLNISPGFNEELKKNCPSLLGYMQYVEKVRRYRKHMPLEKAIDQAVAECIKEGILAEFFRKNRAEVIQMSIFEYDQEAHMRIVKQEGFEEGQEKGRKEGRKQYADFVKKMLADGRTEELQRSTTDMDLQDRLMKEYGFADNDG